MACPKGHNIRLPKSKSWSGFLFLSIILVLDACSFPVQPRYESFPGSGSWSTQGYQDLEIDEHTYLVMYRNYFSISVGDIFAEKWLMGAQEYALYRAGELIKAKGGKYFVVLYKDDWNVTGTGVGKYRQAIVEPGAGILVRVLSHYPSIDQKDDSRIYDADTLLQSLVKKNVGLAEYNGQPTHLTETIAATSQLIRWRSSIHAFDRTKVPKFEWFNGKFFEYGSVTDITKISANVFEITISSLSWISPLQMLWQCVEIAGQEGYEVFTLEDWTVEQHGHPAIWFRTKAKVILQYQEEPESLLPVFNVKKIRSSVDTPDRFNRKYSGEYPKDVRFGNTAP